MTSHFLNKSRVAQIHSVLAVVMNYKAFSRYYPKVSIHLRSKLSREHLSVMSGISPAGRLYVQIQERSFKGADVISFLRHLLMHITGKILVVLDGCQIHRSNEIKKFLVEDAEKRIWIDAFLHIVRI